MGMTVATYLMAKFLIFMPNNIQNPNRNMPKYGKPHLKYGIPFLKYEKLK